MILHYTCLRSAGNSNFLQAPNDTKFQSYTPRLAYFFPGQGAQTVGMAKVSKFKLAKDSSCKMCQALGSVWAWSDIANLLYQCTKVARSYLDIVITSTAKSGVLKNLENYFLAYRI